MVKSYLKNIVITVMVIVLFLFLSLTIYDKVVFAINESTSTDFSIDTAYEYPIQPGTEEWFAIEKHSEKVKLCQIPENILKEMTTDALIETIINYPYFGDMTAFSDPKTGYTSVRDSFNGLQELEQRSDGMNKLLDYYENIMTNQIDMNVVIRAAIEMTLLESESSYNLEQTKQINSFDNFTAVKVFYPQYSIATER